MAQQAEEPIAEQVEEPKETCGRIIKECKRCTGSGRAKKGTFGNGAYGGLCQGCIGKGCLMLIDEEPCKECQGRGVEGADTIGAQGREHLKTAEYCMFCRGNGYQNIMKNPKIKEEECVEVECRFCHDRKTTDAPCRSCNATAKQLVYKDKIPCGYCEHTGKQVDKRTACYHCKGSGWAFLFKKPEY